VPGRGTVFSIELPLDEPSAPRAVSAAQDCRSRPDAERAAAPVPPPDPEVAAVSDPGTRPA
jgi:hypothetical protein